MGGREEGEGEKEEEEEKEDEEEAAGGGARLEATVEGLADEAEAEGGVLVDAKAPPHNIRFLMFVLTSNSIDFSILRLSWGHSEAGVGMGRASPSF